MKEKEKEEETERKDKKKTKHISSPLTLGQNAASLVAVVNKIGKLSIVLVKSDCIHVDGHGGGPKG